MMTLSKKTHIRNYLISKKLPLDVLMEVTDHFEIQVESLQREEEISFDEAFKLTENIWQKDFRLTKKSFFFLWKSTCNCKGNSERNQQETPQKVFNDSFCTNVIAISYCKVYDERLLFYDQCSNLCFVRNINCDTDHRLCFFKN